MSKASKTAKPKRKPGRPRGNRMPTTSKNVPLNADEISRLTAASIKACLPGTVICRRGIEREVDSILGNVS